MRVRLEETLEYIYVLRSVESNQDAKALRTRLKSLRAEVVPDLKADLTLDGVSHTIDRSYTVRKDNFLLVHENNVNEVVLGQALAEAIGVKSQADTYENLLRCNGNDQRKEKLLAKGITGAEVDRLLREYSEIPIEIDVPPVKPAQGEQTVLKGKGKDKPGPQVKPPSKGKNAGRKPEAPSLQLKRAGASHYVVRSEPTASPGGGGGGGAGGVRSPNEGRVLSQQERREIEECGRAFAQLELEKISYTVEQKPFENPGFDILAKRGGEELHVEVKAHLGRATIVDIGTRQYQAFVRSSSKEDGRYRWELWNIEHLSENENKGVVITKYTTIPDEALDVRTFRVDLKKCS